MAATTSLNQSENSVRDYEVYFSTQFKSYSQSIIDITNDTTLMPTLCDQSNPSSGLHETISSFYQAYQRYIKELSDVRKTIKEKSKEIGACIEQLSAGAPSRETIQKCVILSRNLYTTASNMKKKAQNLHKDIAQIHVAFESEKLNLLMQQKKLERMSTETEKELQEEVKSVGMEVVKANEVSASLIQVKQLCVNNFMFWTHLGSSIHQHLTLEEREEGGLKNLEAVTGFNSLLQGIMEDIELATKKL